MKKTLIFSAIVATLLLSGCDKAKEHRDTTTKKATEATTHTVEKMTEATKKIAKDTTEATKEMAKKVVEKTKEAVKATTGTVAEKTTEIKEAVEKKVEEAKVAVAPKVEEAKVAVAPKVDGAKLFATCAGCHGLKGEKKALGQSQVIGGWDTQKTINALNGYKAGTYGGAMKGVMAGQVAKLDEAKIKALAEYISTLK
jgi:cytochrome c553